ncbi:MAG TPA: TolC family protein [Firmicutes bacterium]|uniref:TolC family protein n=1 Tax=Capillibacterium thermochitinicola TaxID=2699427 RepID=A0A8J6LLC9_9FIRM|nr:TolC family protein [Capillibacterium thermochitinicola]MBA2132274.1 TolC family protein [Capillibacterium thermochitinicola]HHW12942.1 TolC family protein [Bacillota bacterium]
MRKNIIYAMLLGALMALVISPLVPAAATQELSLAEALALGLEANYGIKKAWLTWENARLNYERNKVTSTLAGSRHTQLQLELNLLQAEDNYRRTKNQALLQIARKYLEVLQTEQEITWRQKRLAWETLTLEQLKQRVAQGYETRLALMRQENEYHRARLELKKAEDSYEQLRRQLAKEIGWPPDGPVFRLQPVETALTWELSETDCQNRARASSLSLRAVTLEVELAQIALERAQLGSVPAVELQELKNNLQLALLRQEETAWELENSVRQQYAALKQLTEDLALNRVHLAAVRANFEKVQKQYEVGLLKEVDRLAAEAELLQAEYQMFSAVTNYQLKKWEFQQMLGLDLEV